MLDTQTFKVVVENTPLVSIDLCIVCRGEILLGKRNNEPLEGWWFTPGSRILKNESWQNCLRRVALSELRMPIEDIDTFTLMGVWDHFYPNSTFSQNISTHYVNLPHYIFFESKPGVVADDQHVEFMWFDLEAVSNDEAFHPYMRNYAGWLINKMEITDD